MEIDLPPPAAPTSRSNVFRSLARLSWLTILISILANIFLVPIIENLVPETNQYAGPVISGLCFVTGVVSGISALCGVGQYGRQGILLPALSGLAVWTLLMIGALMPFVLKTRLQPRPQRQLTALTHTPGATLVRDDLAGFSFDLPAGYESMPPASIPSDYQQGFVQPMIGEPNRILLVGHLPGYFSARQRLQARDLPANMPGVTLTTFRWRGLEVDAVRELETRGDVRYLTLNVKLPLRWHAGQFTVGGSEQSEPILRALIEQILSTLDGEPYW